MSRVSVESNKIYVTLQTTNNMKEKCAHHTCSHDEDIRKISIVFAIICVFFTIELWGHFRTKSLSLLADALHLLVDISGFIVSITTLRLSKRLPDYQMNFGYQRMEILGALFSVFLIWSAVVYLIAESIHKYLHPREIDGKVFLEIAVAGLVVNLVCMFVLHHKSHSHEHGRSNLNMRATYVHVIGDIIQSIGVIIASIVIFYFPRLVVADIVCTLFFAVLVFISTFSVVNDAVEILSERAPCHINQDEIKQHILSMKDILKVTDMKLWSISTNVYSISVKILADHILIRDYENILRAVREYLSKEHQIHFISIQIDTPLTNQSILGFEVNETLSRASA